MENLFDTPTVLRDPMHFVGRRSELRRIFGLVKTRQSVSLFGPRRIGKTSLLNCLRSREIQEAYGFDGSRFLFVYLDLQKQTIRKNNVEFLTYIYQGLKEQAHSQGYAVGDNRDSDGQLDALLDAFQNVDLHPVVMIDAFDEIRVYQPFDEKIFAFLRSIGGEGKISFITASIDHMSEIFDTLPRKYSAIFSPFYNIFAYIQLKRFSMQEAQEFLIDLSAKGGLPFSDEEVTWVIQQAGRHPYLLQQVATLLFEARRDQDAKEVDYRSIQREAQQNVFSHFEDTWRRLKAADRQTLVENIAAPQVGDEGPKEQNDGEICPEFQGSWLFSSYLRKHVPGKSSADSLLSKLDVDDLKRFLTLLDDLEALGRSELASVPFIAARIKQQQATLPAVRGKIIRDILTRALENMRGQGQHRDRASDWNYYNILYYRYFTFRQRMKQEEIADRLNFSDRQYYRVFQKALERFKNVLLALEADSELGKDEG